MENVSVYIRLLACLVCGGGFSLAALLAISLARLSSLISQAEEARAIAALVERKKGVGGIF